MTNAEHVLEPEVLKLSDDWLVLSKPAGWLTIPGRSGPGVPILKDWVERKYGKAWVVHRLDRETSGLVLFARNAQIHVLANLWFRQRKVKKAYVCLAEGQAQAPFLKVSEPIEGLASSTQFEVLEQFRFGFLAQAFPRTGRRHQIRIHLSKSGYPLMGDPTYGGKAELPLHSGGVLKISRVALHASSLDLPTGERFECPLPNDFDQWLKVLRADAGAQNAL